MKPGLILALSEFSKGQWAVEPPQTPRHPNRQNLLAGAWSWLSRLTPRIFARYLAAFFVGVIATLAWQSYRGGTQEETFAAASLNRDPVQRSVDKLAAEIAKVRAVEQDILQRISAPSQRPSAAPPRNPGLRSSAVR